MENGEKKMSEIELTKKEKSLIRHGLIVGAILGFLLGISVYLSIIKIGALLK